MRKITDPNSISKLTLSLLQNNALSKRMMLVLKVIEGMFIVFYSLVMQQQMLKSLQVDYVDQNASVASDDVDIHLSFSFLLRFLDMMVGNEDVISIITVALTFFLFIILVFLVILIYTHSALTLNDLKH